MDHEEVRKPSVNHESCTSDLLTYSLPRLFTYLWSQLIPGRRTEVSQFRLIW